MPRTHKYRTNKFQTDIDLVKQVHLFRFYGYGRTPENVQAWETALGHLEDQVDLDTVFHKWDMRFVEAE
jgi:hypothetical protein